MNEFVVCLFFVLGFFVKKDSPDQKKHPLDDLFRVETVCIKENVHSGEVNCWLILWIILDVPGS